MLSHFSPASCQAGRTELRCECSAKSRPSAHLVSIVLISVASFTRKREKPKPVISENHEGYASRRAGLPAEMVKLATGVGHDYLMDDLAITL
jgi:hypothetical protein